MNRLVQLFEVNNGEVMWATNTKVPSINNYNYYQVCKSAYFGDSFDEGSGGQLPGSVHGFAVIVGTPRRAVYVDVMRIQTQWARFHRIRYVTIQHANTLIIRK